jgi:hypothetical protein
MTLEKPLAFDQIPPEITERGVGRLAVVSCFYFSSWVGKSGVE